jgi:hypothetical protein
MINHVLTLLRNRSASFTDDEFVPPEFVPCEVPPVVVKIHNLMVAKSPYRLRQIMQVLHATELEKYVLAKDPRVTYLPFDDVAWDTSPGNLAEVLQRLQRELTEDDERELFGAEPDELMKPFYKLWKESDQLPYKLGGLMLAVAERTERVRR